MPNANLLTSILRSSSLRFSGLPLRCSSRMLRSFAKSWPRKGGRQITRRGTMCSHGSKLADTTVSSMFQGVSSLPAKPPPRVTAHDVNTHEALACT